LAGILTGAKEALLEPVTLRRTHLQRRLITMAATSSMPLNGEFKHAHFEDPAFDPNPGFDFDDTDHDVFHGMHGDVAPLDVFDQGGYPGLSTAASQR